MAVEVVGWHLVLQLWLITLLLIELGTYSWLVGRLTERGISGVVIIATVLALAVLWRAAHASTSFIVASVLRMRDGRHEASGTALTALWGEFCARLISYNVSQPFASVVMGREPTGASTGTPVLLVHGYFSNRGLWSRFRQRLRETGVGPIFTIDLEPPFGTIDHFAQTLHRRIEDICRQTQSDNLTLIAHSMGGLVTRAYMVVHGTARIDSLITLGSPHHGTALGAFGVGRGAQQLRRDSEWLSMLEDMESASDQPRPPTLSIYTRNDDLVYPPESAELAWARNVAVRGVGHVALLFSAEVFALVQDYLTNRDGLFQAKSAENARQ